MGSPKTHPNGLKLKTLLILILIISLTFFPASSEADGSGSTEDSRRKGVKEKMVLGSRPPGCFNKCLGCNPCKAALVISPHHKASSSVHQRDEGYYLLSWKCKCGNKIFQP